MNVKGNIRTIIVTSFLLLFVLRSINETMFRHLHYIDHSFIVHSHPFQEEDHHHNSSELLLINQVNSINFINDNFHFSIEIKSFLLHLLKSENILYFSEATCVKVLSLRAPPF